jgi:hypothetical protein
MNIETFQRAKIADAAYCAARHTGSLDCMKAIVYVWRNRLKAGWGDGTWLTIVRGQKEVAGNEPEDPIEVDLADRLLNMLVRDIDDMYMGVSYDETRAIVEGTVELEAGKKPVPALYYHFIDRPSTPWFTDNIVREYKSHPCIARIGTLALFA